MTFDIVLLFVTRILRLIAFGMSSVSLTLYLQDLGFEFIVIGSILSGTLVGDTLISLFITMAADSAGRRRMLACGALLQILGGGILAYISSANLPLVLLATIVGVISPSGSEVGPFLALEQSMLADAVSMESRTNVFAWHNMLGSFATAVGSLVAGVLTKQLLDAYGMSELDSFRIVFALYAVVGALMLVSTVTLSKSVELKKTSVTQKETQESEPLLPDSTTVVDDQEALEQQAIAEENLLEQQPQRFLGFSSRKNVALVVKLCFLFSLDAFGGGLVYGTLMASYFHDKYGMDTQQLGTLLFGANVIAGFSSLGASWIVSRIGVVNTMVFTHLPSNVLLAAIPFMPNSQWAVAILLLRFSISQMDTAPRSTFITSVVPHEDRTKSMGVINVARTLSSAFSATLTGYLAQQGLFGYSFLIAGSLKFLYDIIFYIVARNITLVS